jgi:hypothetical protein
MAMKIGVFLVLFGGKPRETALSYDAKRGTRAVKIGDGLSHCSARDLAAHPATPAPESARGSSRPRKGRRARRRQDNGVCRLCDFFIARLARRKSDLVRLARDLLGASTGFVCGGIPLLLTAFWYLGVIMAALALCLTLTAVVCLYFSWLLDSTMKDVQRIEDRFGVA